MLPTVLHVTNAFPYEGTPEYGVFVKEQIRSLESHGLHCETYFINGRKNGRSAYIDSISDIRALAKGFDVIHCHHLYSAFAASLAFTGKPIVLSFLNDWLHEMDGVPYSAARVIGCNLGVVIAKKVIFKSPIPRQFTSRKKFVHIPNGINAEQFHITSKSDARARLNLDHGAIYILFVSSKDINRRQKRYDRFQEAIDIVRQKMPGRSVKELVLVNQPREVVLDYFNAADLHLMTSDYEGSPNSVKEALCCGAPVVTTEVGNVVEMLQGVPGSYVARTKSPTDLADLAVKSLSENADRQAVRRRFLELGLSQEAVVAKLTALYQEAIR